MNTSIIKLLNLTVLALASIFSESAFSATFDQIEQITDWILKYERMGLIPTKDELQKKSNSLNMSFEDAQSVLDTTIENHSNRVMFDNSIKLFNAGASTAIVASNSKSNGTRLLARKMTVLLTEYTDEIQKRDADGFSITCKKILDLAQILAYRDDAEKTIEDIRKGIPAGKNQGQLSAENEIKSLLKIFAQNEDNPEFIPMPWVENLLATKVNPYIARWNSENVGGKSQPLPHVKDSKELHDILD